MGRQRTPAGVHIGLLPPPLLSAEEWNGVVQSLHLTRQQAKIVCLILQGRRDKQIAADLQMSRSTVRTHLRTIFAKLAVSDRVELVVRAWAACRNLASSAGSSSSKMINHKSRVVL